jgi:hypothetical protein
MLSLLANAGGTDALMEGVKIIEEARDGPVVELGSCPCQMYTLFQRFKQAWMMGRGARTQFFRLWHIVTVVIHSEA